MPKCQMDYSHTIIYKICCKNTNIKDTYIGHTTNFTKRKNQHKTLLNNESCNRKVYEFIRANGGWNNWSMLQIEDYNCQNKREAEMRERYWIETLQSSLNCNIPITTKEEKDFQKQDWYEENKVIILEKAKEKYEENKEEKLEYQKEYATKNKEQLKSYHDEYREKNKEKLAEQKKEYRETHKEEASKMQKEWREVNKEKLKEQRAQVCHCDCGSEYTINNKSRHLQSKIHILYQNQLNGIIEEKILEEDKIIIIKQKQKEYREKNEEKIKEFKKQYNEKNKEKVSEQCKKYYEENKEKILEQTKIYTSKNADKIKQNKREWYEKNKEKILLKQQELFICDCGSEINYGGKAEHYKSEKHIKYISKL
jgi:glucosamine 6-phosphate synthetase-like amidotransferase/phosphosugar isomerase protein